ncbi:MAG: CBS domain-containing protein [Deltaproteobacteria bacterium]|nr:CBS domain-containing protein [Deltaproteobacteria bacterium]
MTTTSSSSSSTTGRRLSRPLFSRAKPKTGLTVRDAMRTELQTAAPDTDLATIARFMWERDCGIIPIVTAERRLVGVITDRDICIAAATKGRAPAYIRAQELLSAPVVTCSPDDDCHAALTLLCERQLRRLPVVDADGQLVGIVSLIDFIRIAQGLRGAKGLYPSYEEIVSTLKSIGETRVFAAA